MSARYVDVQRARKSKGGLTAAILADPVPTDPTAQFQTDVRKTLSAAVIAVIAAAAQTIADNTGGNADEIEASLQAQYGPQFASANAAAQGQLIDELNNLADAAINPVDPDVTPLGESDDVPVKSGLIRGILMLAGGIGLGSMAARRGSSSADNALGDGSGSISQVGGVGSGSIVTGMLADNGITPQSPRYIWDYTDADRTEFPPHLDLDGYTFDSWDDEGLAVPSGYEWLDTAFLCVQDHDGCMCSIVLNYGDEADMGFPSPGGVDISDEVPLGDFGDEAS